MDFRRLLNGKADCSCHKEHICAIQRVEIGRNMLEKIPEFCDIYHHILIVADKNTFAACGERVYKILGRKVETLLCYESDGFLVPDEKAVARLEKKITGQTDFILGVGSGVINDLCKFCSFEKKLPYGIVMTAPSMDGYASSAAAMLMGNMKITYPAQVPQMIFGDLDVLKNAPDDLIRAGFGDIIGKYSALCDWKLAHFVRGEYFCPWIYQLVMEAVERVADISETLMQKGEEEIRLLTEALIVVGIAMAYADNSRPASGAEHHLAHYFEVTGLLNGEKYMLHGMDVAYATIEVQRIREALVQRPWATGNLVGAYQQWKENLKRVYGKIADEMIELQEKAGFYTENERAFYIEHRDEIEKILMEPPAAQEILQLLRQTGMAYTEFLHLYGERKIKEAICFAKDLKDRYTVLWPNQFLWEDGYVDAE